MRNKRRRQMRHINLKRAVEKFASVKQYMHGNTNAYTAEVMGYVITWLTPYYTPEEAHCVNVRRSCDKNDWVSDYHAGAYYDTIKSAIRALTFNLNKESERVI